MRKIAPLMTRLGDACALGSALIDQHFMTTKGLAYFQWGYVFPVPEKDRQPVPRAVESPLRSSRPQDWQGITIFQADVLNTRQFAAEEYVVPMCTIRAHARELVT